ncbi:hypothetical protein F5Y18DRAFT_397002 [Xylariaceae sp. FL1019]|nr:hypothetical protein F5Y18DRAFT_397002 [Xylariaceae sp. FL1019]
MESERKNYDPIPRESTDDWDADTIKLSTHRRRYVSLGWPALLITLLILSLTLNGLLFYRNKTPLSLDEAACPSYYAGLKRDLPTVIRPYTEYTIPEDGYTKEDLLAVAPLWDKLRGDPGVLALSSEYQKEKGLHEAIPFPWDEDKGVYFFQAYHNLHCLRTLFRYVNYTETGVPNKIAASHALHCLDQLRQDVICQADDTPRYAWTHPPGTGFNQVRMCKDWKKLEQWSLEHTACFKNTDGIAGPIIDRFKSCPDGQVLWPTP